MSGSSDRWCRGGYYDPRMARGPHRHAPLRRGALRQARERGDDGTADEAIIAEGAYWVRLSIARRKKVARYVTPDQMEALEADMRKHARFVSKHGWLQPCEECGYWAYVLDELGLPPEN